MIRGVHMGVLVFALAAVVATPVQSASGKADAAHRRGICGEVVKIDLMLYDDPTGHAPTATCSYTDERLLVKPRTALPEERMKRFVFLAFLVAGKLSNDDFMMPPRVFVGFGKDCQVVRIAEAALLQRNAKFGGDLGFATAYGTASGAPKVACPK